jgi:MFS family permease
MGRRRGWLLLIQLTLIGRDRGLGFTDPAQSLPLVTLAAFLVSFFSASQDIVIDAYRRESLADDEQGLGASLYVNGYRVGMLLSSGGGLILADFIPVYRRVLGDGGSDAARPDHHRVLRRTAGGRRYAPDLAGGGGATVRGVFLPAGCR